MIETCLRLVLSERSKDLDVADFTFSMAQIGIRFLRCSLRLFRLLANDADVLCNQDFLQFNSTFSESAPMFPIRCCRLQRNNLKLKWSRAPKLGGQCRGRIVRSVEAGLAPKPRLYVMPVHEPIGTRLDHEITSTCSRMLQEILRTVHSSRSAKV